MDFPMSVGPYSSKQFTIFWRGKNNSIALKYFILIFKIMRDIYRPFILLLILNHFFFFRGRTLVQEMQDRAGSLKLLALVMCHKMLCRLIKCSYKE